MVFASLLLLKQFCHHFKVAFSPALAGLTTIMQVLRRVPAALLRPARVRQ
jgi:hypothetical protein